MKKNNHEPVISRLLEGNKRFCNSTFDNPNRSKERRTELTKGQNPFAVIICCSDSRVPPEIIFDQGIGDLFVIRLAGNVITKEVLASTEFAVEQLKSSLVMVLGHESCGAVKASLSQNADMSDNMKALMNNIPSVEVKEDQLAMLNEAIRKNTIQASENLTRNSAILARAVEENRLEIVPANYSLTTGEVEIIK